MLINKDLLFVYCIIYGLVKYKWDTVHVRDGITFHIRGFVSGTVSQVVSHPDVETSCLVVNVFSGLVVTLIKSVLFAPFNEMYCFV